MKRLLWVGNQSAATGQRIFAALDNVNIIFENALSGALLRLGPEYFHAVVLTGSAASASLEDSIRQLLTRCRVPVIVHDVNGTVDDAIRYTQLGAFYTLLGDLDFQRLAYAVNLAIENAQSSSRENEADLPSWRKMLVGQSSAMLQICEIVKLVASKRATVLIAGETGTGKEVIARALHAASNRSSAPMVAVNCTALPASLIETELFGHAKGAFTGAHMSRVGRFEQAHRGTIFLDEIGDLPLDAQAKLLRVLQEGEFQRVGSSETVRVDVRVIAASNVDLEEAVRQRKFREDLYYRLNVVPIQMPALRDRREDIPLLLDHFLEKNRIAENLPAKQITPEAVDFLADLDWPGNVRQLEHAVQMAFALSGERHVLHRSDFASLRPRAQRTSTENRPLVTVSQEGLDFDEVVGSFERSLLNQALAVSGGNKARAADLLRIKRTTLLAKMKTFEERDAARGASELRCCNSDSAPRRAVALVAEEDAAVRKLLAKTLEKEGYRVLEASTSSAAVDLFQCWSNQISVVVVAAELPGMPGEELVDRLRVTSSNLPAVLISDRLSTRSVQARLEVISRPFSPADIVSALNELTRPKAAELSSAFCA